MASEAMEKLYAKRDTLRNTLKDIDVSDKFDEAQSIIDQINVLDKQIDAQEAKEKIVVDSLKLDDVNNNNKKDKFNSFGEFLNAVKIAGQTKDRVVDPRLKNAIKGVNETTNADGGYLVQEDYLGVILDGARERSQILQRCRKYTISSDSNRINYTTLDLSGETAANAGTVVAGGVQAYWVDEGGTVTPSKPKWKSNEIKLGKIMGIAYVTNEMLQDAAFMAGFLEDGFSEATAGLLTDGVLNGVGESVDGSAPRQPVGLLNSNAAVAVAMSDTAAAKKLKAQDLLNMKSALRPKNWANAAWYIHPDYEADLPLLTDDNGNQLFMPAGGVSGAQYDTILGRPVIYDEFLPAKGTYGSILLADMNEYMLISKGNERKEWSMHVEFLTDQQCFRIVLRVGGAPINNTTYTVRHSTQKRGVFVALGTKPTTSTK